MIAIDSHVKPATTAEKVNSENIGLQHNVMAERHCLHVYKCTV